VSEGNVPRREDTETTQQRFLRQDVVLVVGALVLGFSLAILGGAMGRKYCPRS
jgi:hypothetical protein